MWTSVNSDYNELNCLFHPSFSTSLCICFSLQKWNVSQTKIRVTSTVLFILFGCLLFVALPALIFQHIEGWSALEAIYFVVITLTTIGFGDFVAGEGSHYFAPSISISSTCVSFWQQTNTLKTTQTEVVECIHEFGGFMWVHLSNSGGSEIEYLDYYKPLVWFWILVGLAYFAAVLSMIGDWLRVISKKTKEEVCAYWYAFRQPHGESGTSVPRFLSKNLNFRILAPSQFQCELVMNHRMLNWDIY